VNRFDYDFERDAMMKKNDQFRFCEVLNLDDTLPEETNYSQVASKHRPAKNLYHLHSILIHRGTLGAGHYFAFIRPSLAPDWYEFNDSLVTPIAQSTALAIGAGGQYSFFEAKNGYVQEKARTSDTSAYMLVYVRDGDRGRVLNEVAIQEIPQHLQVRFDEENKINQKLDEDLVYL